MTNASTTKNVECTVRKQPLKFVSHPCYTCIMALRDCLQSFESHFMSVKIYIPIMPSVGSRILYEHDACGRANALSTFYGVKVKVNNAPEGVKAPLGVYWHSLQLLFNYYSRLRANVHPQNFSPTKNRGGFIFLLLPVRRSEGCAVRAWTKLQQKHHKSGRDLELMLLRSIY